jgi:membrane protease YdiL (CAAX protease family)
MQNAVERCKAPAARSAGAWSYILLAFAWTWTAWIVSIKLHAREEFLYIGTAGPAIAALVLCGGLRPSNLRPSLKRTGLFLGLLILLSALLTLYYSLRTHSGFSFHMAPLVLVPASIPAWILSSAFSRDREISSLFSRLIHRPNRWSLIALLIFPAVILSGAAIGRLLHQPLVMPPKHGSAINNFAYATVFFLFNIFFAALLEEPGWRGFLLPRLQRRWSPLLATLLVWLPWALWHAPLDYFRPGRFSLVAYLEMRVIFLIPIALILTWLYNRSGRSVQATTIFHASMNTFPFVLPYFMPSFALLFVIAGFAIVSDRMWRHWNDGVPPNSLRVIGNPTPSHPGSPLEPA